MNIIRKDPSLLIVFHTLYQEKNVSKAAERLFMSQPGLSHQLQRLREEWGDPLFVKAARGLTPTPKAHALALPVAHLVAEIESFYNLLADTPFHHRSDKVTIYTTDYMEQRLLPKLLVALQKNAPKVQLVTTNTQGKFPHEALENGLCDIAIAGFFKNLANTYHHQHLIDEPFKIVIRKEHPIAQKGVSLETYVQYPHVVTSLKGDLSSAIDVSLHSLGLSRHVIAGVSSFLSTATVIREGDWLLTCLSSLAEKFCKQDPSLLSLPLPEGLNIRPIALYQVWHARTHNDPLRRWIRKEVEYILTSS